jgi:hypothetical protein
MIDMSPSDLSCINSTLHFVCEQSKRYGVTPVLTFDQPLFQKASHIITSSEGSSPLKNIVLILGAFHTEMSFLGTKGYIMAGSGLQEVLQTVYAQNAVSHIMTGKAISRAIRGHFMVDTILHALLLSKIYPNVLVSHNQQDVYNTNGNISEDNDCSMTDDSIIDQDAGSASLPSEMASLSEVYEQLEAKDISINEVFKNENLKIVTEKIEGLKIKLCHHRTARLWFQYMDMIAVLQQFIRAERIGDWTGHLRSLRKMLPYFAASGHYLYLKSAYIYLQNMMSLENKHPEVYQQFLVGNHVVRRTDRYWGGLSTDLIIEQVLMRSLKSTGGLTRGRGMSESQRTLWLLSMPACAEMNQSMQEFSGMNFVTSEQHQDASSSRRNRDSNDANQVLQFFQARSPFEEGDTSLRNIDTGVTADKRVNVDLAHDLGKKIIKDMVGQSLDDYVFRRKDQAVPLSDNSSVKIDDETVSIDPQLLFQRLITVADRSDEDIASIFKFELSTNPSSLFDNSGLPRAAQKSQLADAIWKLGYCGSDQDVEEDRLSYVVDGGSLIQKIPWPKNSTFRIICEHYYHYRISGFFCGLQILRFFQILACIYFCGLYFCGTFFGQT